jgi:hypothetical protein
MYNQKISLLYFVKTAALPLQNVTQNANDKQGEHQKSPAEPAGLLQ